MIKSNRCATDRAFAWALITAASSLTSMSAANQIGRVFKILARFWRLFSSYGKIGLASSIRPRACTESPRPPAWRILKRAPPSNATMVRNRAKSPRIKPGHQSNPEFSKRGAFASRRKSGMVRLAAVSINMGGSWSPIFKIASGWK